MTSKSLPLDQVLPGAVLGDNVHDEAGRVLLRAGAVLSESAIEALRRRKVEQVVLEVIEKTSPEQLALEKVRLETRLEAAFRRAGHSEANRQLWQAILEFKLETK